MIKLSPHKLYTIAFLAWIGVLITTQTAMAHHAFGGTLPKNFFEGFLAGLAHPVIGLDHLAFIVAIGLISVKYVPRFLLPTTFVLASLAGTGVHLLALDLPAAEIAVSVSVIVFGVMLLISKTVNWIVMLLLATIAGIFHGYAYGESIVGAQMSPLFAYLLGFSFIQFGIAMFAGVIGKFAIEKFADRRFSVMQFSGLAICAIGVVFLTSAIGG